MPERVMQPWPARATRWQTLRIRRPRTTEPPAGAGDLLKTATTALGIPPCGGCERRAAVLNRLLPLPRRGQHAHRP